MRAALLAVIVCAACAEPASLTQEARPVTVEPLFDLHVPARTPSPHGKAPALVLIHGVGSHERDLVGLASAFDARLDVHSLRAPLVRGPESFAWFSVTFGPQGPIHDATEAEAARQKIVAFVRALREDPAIDPTRIYLLGFSQGAILSLSVAYTEPTLIAGVVAISGRTLQEIAAGVKGKRIESGPRVLLMHGTDDTKLPFAHAEASEHVLKGAGLPYDFKSYPVGHTVSAPMRDDIAAWLSAQLTR
jgi:phospholipase/carboxylesterase